MILSQWDSMHIRSDSWQYKVNAYICLVLLIIGTDQAAQAAQAAQKQKSRTTKSPLKCRTRYLDCTAWKFLHTWFLCSFFITRRYPITVYFWKSSGSEVQISIDNNWFFDGTQGNNSVSNSFVVSFIFKNPLCFDSTGRWFCTFQCFCCKLAWKSKY